MVMPTTQETSKSATTTTLIKLSPAESLAFKEIAELLSWSHRELFADLVTNAIGDLVIATSRLSTSSRLGRDIPENLSAENKLGAVKYLIGQASVLYSVDLFIGWYQLTQLEVGPLKDPQRIGELRSTCQGLAHRLLIDPKLEELLVDCNSPEVQSALDSDFDRKLVRRTLEQVLRKKKVPTELVKELAELESRGVSAWEKAREQKDFSIVAPVLKEIVEKRRVYAGHLQIGQTPYDSLLDDFDRGASPAKIDALFASLKRDLKQILSEIKSKDPTETAPPTPATSGSASMQLSEIVLASMGYQLDHGRIDVSTHPFCQSIVPPDVVVLTIGKEGPVVESVLTALHEGGHAVFSQGLDRRTIGTLLESDVSLALHEGMAKLYECVIGRSKAFWQGRFEDLKALSPETAALGLDQFMHRLNRIQPHPVRLESDELTYNLHIMLRYQIERDLVNGKIQVEDLPRVWNAAVKEFLGIEPKDDLEGVLQDTHWYSTMLGYFPCYSVGNLISAQLFRAACNEQPMIAEQIELGNLKPLTQWLRDKVFRFGGLLTWQEILLKATGKELSTEDYVSLMRERYLY